MIARSDKELTNIQFEKRDPCPFTKHPIHKVVVSRDLGCVTLPSDMSHCFLGHSDGKVYHVFKQVQASYFIDGKILLGLYPEKKKYGYYILENGSIYLMTDITHTSGYFYQSTQFPTTIKENIVNTLTHYFEKLLPKLNTRQDVELHLPPRDLFDSVIIENRIYPLKLLKLLPSWIDFYGQLRDVIFGFVERYAVDHEDELLTNKTIRVKEMLVCSIESMIKLPTFKCLNKYCKNAEFLEGKSETVLPPLPRDATICLHVLKEVLKKYGSNVNLAPWGFECKFLVDSVGSGIMVKSFMSIFGRRDPMHRNCVPAKYLGKSWMEWLLSIKS